MSHSRQSDTSPRASVPDRPRRKTVHPTVGHDAESPSHRAAPEAPATGIGFFAASISFLRESEQREVESPDQPRWQRYVCDRLRHFTISHR